MDSMLEKGIAEMVQVEDDAVMHKGGGADKRKEDESRRQPEERSLTKLTGSFYIAIHFFGPRKGLLSQKARKF